MSYSLSQRGSMFTVSIKKINTIDALKGLNVDNILITDNTFGSGQCGFSNEEIKKCVLKAHDNHFKVWLRVDKLYSEDELDALKEYLDYLVSIKVDAVLYTDMAVKVLLEKQDIKIIYAPETLLTNIYDVQICLKEADYCVISKDITLDDVYKIVDQNKRCFIRIHGPILISYSARRFISSYLDKYDQEYLDGYYLKEESRDEYLPIIERKDGSWLYGFNLESFKEINEMKKHQFEGFIIDNMLSEDTETISVLKKYVDIINGNSQVDYEHEDKMSYLSISEIKETERLK